MTTYSERRQLLRQSQMEEIGHLLGTMPDAVLARKENITIYQIVRLRAEGGIPAYSTKPVVPRPPLPEKCAQGHVLLEVGVYFTPTPMCRECHRVSVRRRRDRLLKMKMCAQCGDTPAREGKQTCVRCAKKQVKATKKIERRRLLSGMCGKCGKKPHQDGRKMCDGCYRGMLRHTRERRRKRIGQGNCGSCGKPRGEDGTPTECRACRKRDMESRRKRNVVAAQVPDGM